MRKWSKKSKLVLDSLDPRLQRVMNRVLQEVADISLTSGHRGEEKQNYLFEHGKSTVVWPNSKHNSNPSIAVDFQPYPYPFSEPKLWGALGYIAGRAMAIGAEEGVVLRWGGDWNGDGDVTNQTFNDLFHLEIKE